MRSKKLQPFRLLWIFGQLKKKKLLDARRVNFDILSVKHGMASMGAEKIGKTPKIVSTVWAFYMKFSSKNIVSAFFSIIFFFIRKFYITCPNPARNFRYFPIFSAPIDAMPCFTLKTWKLARRASGSFFLLN